jgi:hypothetical protein
MIPIILLSGFLVASGTSVSSGIQIVDEQSVSTSVGGNWASLMEGVWYLEEGTTSTRVSSGFCTTSCGLTRTGNVTNNSTQLRQGSYSNIFDGTGDYISCTDANCGAVLNTASTMSISYGCWVRPSGNPANTTITIMDHLTSNAGYRLQATGDVLALTASIQCTINSTSATKATDGNDLSTWQGQWQHFVCSFDDTANTLTAYSNASSSATAAPTSIGSAIVDFSIGGTAALNNTAGNIDECFVYRGTALSSASVCRICSCGIDGSLCTYNPSTNEWINKGRNNLCNNCTMPSNATLAP